MTEERRAWISQLILVDPVSWHPAVQDGGPWRGPTEQEWVERIAAPMLREGETVPLVKELGDGR